MEKCRSLGRETIFPEKKSAAGMAGKIADKIGKGCHMHAKNTRGNTFV
jgi:hypothetical protein